MKRAVVIVLFLLSYTILDAQITIIGHNMINNSPIRNTKIFVTSNGVTTSSLNTQSRSDFKIQLEFGKVYKIYFQNAKSPVMHMEVVANTIPKDKYEYLMTYEMNVPFVNKIDEDIDTTIFAQPFHRIIYNGRTKMADDTIYNNAFNSSIIKKRVIDGTAAKDFKPESIVTLSGKISQESGGYSFPGSVIRLLDNKGQVIKSSCLDRFGGFAFSNVQLGSARQINLEADTLHVPLTLSNSKNEQLATVKENKKKYEWKNENDGFVKLIDNNYSRNIGGKLIGSSPREKKFFANKTVYLTNKYQTVIQKTKTNLFGTFVFEDIRTDHMYFIGVDKSDVGHGERIDLLNKGDQFIATLDSVAGGKVSLKIQTNYNKMFDLLCIGEDEMKMEVKATIFGDNVNNPIGKLKIIMLNDNYEVIDSAITDNFGAFKFKYLPFLKRFYLSAENTDNILDVFKNILIYSSDDNLIKIMTHQKGKKFTYNPVSSELSELRGIELEDPWLELMDEKEEKEITTASIYPKDKKTGKGPAKLIVENIHFENNKSELSPQAREVLDKVILVLNHNKQLKIEVGAHTDSKGSATANLKLSEARAKTVQSYITGAGIVAGRILAKGYGESQLLNDCTDAKECSENDHAKNRRIEFKILGEQPPKQ